MATNTAARKVSVVNIQPKAPNTSVKSGQTAATPKGRIGSYMLSEREYIKMAGWSGK
jgi:hypothetical protein